MKKIKILLLAIITIGLFQTNMFPIIYSRVQGVVLDKETKTPLKNAYVSLFCVTNGKADIFAAKGIRTDINGTFKIDDVIKGKYVISCDLDGYVSLSPLSSIMMKPGGEEDLIFFEIGEGKIKFLELKMEKGGILKVHVSKKDKNGISGFSDVKISILRTEYSQIGKKNFSYTVADMSTDQNGVYSHGGLIPEIEYEILIHPISLLIGLPQYQRTFKIEKNKTIELDFSYDLIDETGLNGSVLIKNKIPSNGSIILWIISGDKGTCVYDGKLIENSKYLIKNINPGHYLIYVTAWDENGNRFTKKNYVDIEKGISKKEDIYFN